MKTEFRNRAFLPLVMPLAILGVIAAVVGVVAAILLFVDRQGAVAIALLGAAGILVAVSLAATRDRLDLPRRGAVALAGVAPLAVGALVAAGVLGGVADEDRNINVEPHAPQFIFDGVLEGAPVLSAVDATSFCIAEGGDCAPTKEWSFSYTPEQIQYAFDNLDSQEHNLMIYNVPPEELSGATENPIGLSELQENYQVITPTETPNIAGGTAQTYQWIPPVEGEGGEEVVPIPEQAYFVCTLHAGSMFGVVDIAPEG